MVFRSASLVIRVCSMAKKSSTFSTFASATMVQKGSPRDIGEQAHRFVPHVFQCRGDGSELFDHLADFPGFALQDLTDHIHNALLRFAYAWNSTGLAAAMMRPTFAFDMKSGSGMAPVIAERKALVASWLPRSAPKRACISGGGGSRAASWVVNSNIGRTRSLRAVSWAASNSSNTPLPESAALSASVRLAASKKASLIPCAVIGSLL